MAENDLVNRLVTDKPPEKVTELSERLATDASLLEKFVARPSAVLKDYGISSPSDIKLGDREKAMIRMFSDPQVIDYYNSGKIDLLRQHIIDKYREIVVTNPGDLRAVAVADFDVAIEVEAVAVAIAVVAVIVAGAAERFSKLATIEAEAGILSAKVAALEARINLVEKLDAKVSRLEQRMR